MYFLSCWFFYNLCSLVVKKLKIKVLAYYFNILTNFENAFSNIFQ